VRYYIRYGIRLIQQSLNTVNSAIGTPLFPMQAELIQEINDLIQNLNPNNVRELKKLLNDAHSDANKSVDWRVIDSKMDVPFRRNIQSAFMKRSCSTEDFQKWIETMRGSDFITERDRKADERTQKSVYWRERVRYQWAEHERMERRQPREELCEK
jgi:hypothetical protein